MFVAYIFTLFLPILFSFGDDCSEELEFFSIFSLNKLLFFVNGMILGYIVGLDIFQSAVLGALQVTLYYYGFKLIRRLEYKPSPKIPAVGDEGIVYSSLSNEDFATHTGKVILNGEVYTAHSAVYIPSFARIKVIGIVNKYKTLIVEEISKEEK